MNVLVLGADGLLGARLMTLLARKPWNLLGFGKSALDITDYAKVELELGRLRPDVVINAAAYTSVEGAESDAVTADAVNRVAVGHLARVVRNLDAALIHFSTDFVFDGRQLRPYVETDITGPLNTYGKTKLAGEMAISEQLERYIIIRTSWLFAETGANFFTKILKSLQVSSEVSVVNDQVGGPTYVNDLVAVVAAILAKGARVKHLPWGLYHYSGFPFVSRYDFASSILAGLPVQPKCVLQPVVTAAYPSAVVRPLNSCLDSSRVSAIWGVGPSDWRKAVGNLSVRREIE